MDKNHSTRHQMRQEMFNSMRELLGSGYIKEHYINCMADFVDIAEGYAEQKHAEQIAALEAEHRAEMAGLCDTFMRNASFLEDGDYEQLRKNVELIKQRISDE